VPGPKTNERPGTRAVLRHYRMSATKARQVLELIRGEDVTSAHEILRTTPREGARVIDKVLHSATSNAVENARQAGAAIDPEELYVSACYADEGTTMKRWRPRARGRATRIRKRTCHITVIVSRLDDEKWSGRTRRRHRRTRSTGSRRRSSPERC
jgi:large subunit ribosomal protein L22